jgi:Amt family ammonium transporter
MKSVHRVLQRLMLATLMMLPLTLSAMAQAPAPAAPAVAPAAASAAAASASALNTGDTAWMLTSTVLVLMMTIPGLALFYGGMSAR